MLFVCRVVVKADRAGDLPGAVLEAPENDEFCFAEVCRVAGMGEAVDADLDGAVIVHGVDLEGAGDEFAVNLAADVVLDGFDERFASYGEAGFVVVELEVLGDHGAQLVEVACVVGVKSAVSRPTTVL
jgi:hypothetical protein